MPRIRSLKPEFFTDSAMVQLSPFARLLFQGMWCHADEWGVLEADPMQLKMRILPMDSVDIEALVQELVDSGRVKHARTSQNESVLVVTKFREHQRPDGRLEPRFGEPSTFTYDDSPKKPPDQHVHTSSDMSTLVETCGEGQGSGYKGQGSSSSELTTVDTTYPDDVIALTAHLESRVKGNGHKTPRTSNQRDKWLDAIDKLLRIDDEDPLEVRAVIDWATSDEFWKANIRSAGKFREKYSQLRLKAAQERASPNVHQLPRRVQQEQNFNVGLVEWAAQGDE